MTYTEEEVKKAIEVAFNSGKIWAETYVSWFAPTEKDHANQLELITKRIFYYIQHEKEL